MDRNDQRAIEDLFDRLSRVEGSAPPRDPEAEAYIREQIARQPGAPYYMAQTVIVQEEALRRAQERIAELEAGQDDRGGGLFGGLFGGGSQQPARSSGRVPNYNQRYHGGDPRYGAGGAGGGFLAGAAQTALGVAGGVMLANMIGGLFGAGEAEAAPMDDQGGGDDWGGDAGGDAGGGDFGDMGF